LSIVREDRDDAKLLATARSWIRLVERPWRLCGSVAEVAALSKQMAEQSAAKDKLHAEYLRAICLMKP
jgi:hypothetical protein